MWQGVITLYQISASLRFSNYFLAEKQWWPIFTPHENE